MERFYPIGTPGEPWGEAEKKAWFGQQTVKRSYRDDVLTRVDRFSSEFEVAQYGALPIDADRYPLIAVTQPSSKPEAPWALVTGGVHGYETSGVHGALAFLETAAAQYRDKVNLLVAPCVSPWGYEVIHRWNPNAVDPNRSFLSPSPAEESAGLMKRVREVDGSFVLHIDLHETTDTDETEFRPALAARDGKASEPGTVPDGFYTVGDTENPQLGFQGAVIEGVSAVTHIAPPDENGQIIGADVIQPGVILYPAQELGLCSSVTRAPFTTTTEVYPDSAKATPEECVAAQVAAVTAALDFALAQSGM